MSCHAAGRIVLVLRVARGGGAGDEVEAGGYADVGNENTVYHMTVAVSY